MAGHRPDQFGILSDYTSTDSIMLSRASVTYSTPLSTFTKIIPSITVAPMGGYAQYVCNGTADQTPINAAIAAMNAAGGGEVFILPGSYSLSGYILPLPKVKVTCLGYCYFTMSVTNSEMIANTQDLTYFTWNGGILNQAGVTSDKQLIRIDGGTDIYFNGVQTQNASHHAIRLTDCHRFGVRDTYSTNPGIVNGLDGCGIVLFGSTDGVIQGNSTYNTAYHGIQCHNDCDRIDIIDNFVNQAGMAAAPGSGIQAQNTCTSINVKGNNIRNVYASGINLDGTNNSLVSDNIIDSTTVTAGIALSTSCSGVNINANSIKNTSYGIKVDTGTKINITSNLIDSPTLNGIFVLGGAALYGSISNNNFVGMAEGATAGIQFEELNTGHATISNNFVQGARYVARFASGTTNCNLTGNYGKIISLATYTQGIRDDSGGATINVDASNLAYI